MSGPAARAAQGRTRMSTVFPDVRPVLCEYMLQDSQHIEQAARRLHSGLRRRRKPADVSVSPWLNPPALEVFNLHDLNLRELKQLIWNTEPGDVEKQEVAQYELLLKNTARGVTEVLDREVLPSSPLFAWEEASVEPAEFENALWSVLDGSTYDFEPADLAPLPVGIILRESGDYGRKFLTLNNVLGKLYLFTLGIDVECESVARFSRNAYHLKVRAEHGWLCRVPVLQVVTELR